MAAISLYGNTNTGMRRQENEDAFICRQLWLPHLYLLAAIDGVGGYAGGAFAAKLAKDAIEQYMKEPKGDILTMLKEAVVFANNNIAAERERQPNFSDMCCVLTAAVVDVNSQSVSYVHVGDSRLYRYSADKLQKITKDHSLVGMQEDAGEITEQEAMSHPQRHMILREIGSMLHRVDDAGFLDFGTTPFLPGDQVLLCSDGLTDMLSAYQLQAVLQQPSETDKKVDKLIRMANEAGGQDNITVVIIKFPISTRRPVVAKKPALPRQTTAVTAEMTGERVSAPRKNGLLLAVLLTVAVLSASGWIWYSNQEPTEKPATTPKLVSAVPDSMKQPASEKITKVDSVRLSKTLSFAEWQHLHDSLQSQLLLLPAEGSNGRFAALHLGQPDSISRNVLLERTRFVGFDTAIVSAPNISLTLNDVGFETVKLPVYILRKR